MVVDCEKLFIDHGHWVQGIGCSCISRKEESVSITVGGDVVSIYVGQGWERMSQWLYMTEAPKNYVIGINQTSKW